ncbi:unnamed protein product [Closterium sp. NIES-53]
MVIRQGNVTLAYQIGLMRLGQLLNVESVVCPCCRAAFVKSKSCSYCTTASVPAATAAIMATPSVLTFDTEGRLIKFEVRLDDLHLFLQITAKDDVSLYDHTFGAAPAPPATADSTARSQWQTRDAHARLAVRSHLPLDEREHFGQHKTAKELYDAVVTRYSSPATAAIGRLSLPYLFPDLSAFATVADLITHLRTSDLRYRAALPPNFLAKNPPPPMYLTLYHLVTRLPDSLRSVRDQFLALSPTDLTVDLLKKELLAAEKSIVAVGTSHGDPRTPFFEGCSPSPLLPSIASAAAVGYLGAEGVGAASAPSGRRKGGTVSHPSVPPPTVPPCDRTGQTCGRFHTEQRCFFRLDDAWREQFPDAAELPRWADLLRKNIDIFALDFDAILGAMYALTISVEGDCYLSVPPDPGIGTSETAPPGASVSSPLGPGEAAALGASASAALGPGEAAAPGACPSTLAGTASTEALHTFTLDSGASRCFFRDRTALEQLARPVAVSLADPSGGPVIATSSTVLPCPAVPSGTLSGLYLPSFSTNLVAGSALQDGGVHQFTPAYERVTHCTCARTGRHLATFTRRPGSDLYTLTTESPQVAASASGQLSAPCSCRSLSHQTVLWHHRLGHPSVQRLRGMHSRYLVSGLPRVLPPLPPSPSPPCLPCVKGRQRAAPHSSSFPPTEAPLQTLHLDVWGPARVRGQGHERYFLLVVDDYTRYTTVFPLRTKGEVLDVLIPWIRAARLQLRNWFQSDFPVLRLHSDRGGEFSSDLLAAYCAEHGIRQTFTLPASPQQNGVAERRIGLVMEIARTSLIHAAAPHFLWPFAVQYAAHQLNLWPRVSASETSPTLLWTGQVGDASRFRVWGARAFVRDTTADKLSARAVPCVFLGFVPDAPGWRFYHPTSRRVFASQDVTFDESVPFYRLFPYRTAPLPPPPLFLTPGAPPVDPLPPQGPAPSGVSQVDAVEPVEVAVDSGPERGTEPGGTETGGAAPGRVVTGDAEPGGAVTGGAEPGGAVTWGPEPGGATPGGAEPRGAEPEGGDPAGAPSSQRLREWYARRCGLRSGAPRFELPPAGGAGAVGGAAGAAGDTGATGGAPGAASAAGGSGAAGGAAGATGGSGAVGGAAGAAGGTGATGGAPSAARAAGVGAAAGGSGPVSAGSGGTSRPRPYFVPLLQQVLGQSPPPGPAPSLDCPSPVWLQSLLQPTSPRPGPSPYTGPTGGLTERREPESRPVSPTSRSVSPVRAARPSRCVPRQRPPAVPGTHPMLLRLSTTPRRVSLPSPPASSLPALADPESDSLHAASPTVVRLLSTVVTDPSFESAAASALVTELVDFAAHCRPDYAAGLVAESESVCPPSVGGECALGTDVLEDRQEEFECFAAAAPHLVSMLIAPEGDPDAPDIPTPRSYAEAIAGEYSSQWQSAMDAEMASWKSTGTYVDEVPPPGANIVSGMWIFRVKQPPGSPPVFKARYVARGFSQREGVDFFQTFSPTPKMTTLRVLLHVAAQRDYELHSLDFSTAFLHSDSNLQQLLQPPRVDSLVPRYALLCLCLGVSSRQRRLRLFVLNTK